MIATTARSLWLVAGLSTCLLSSIFLSSSPVSGETKVDTATKLQRLRSHTKTLQQEPNLPLLPKHPRRKFMGGLSHAQSHGTGGGYGLSYEVEDKADKVIDWYKNALSGLGWTVDSRSISEYQKNRKYLMATREGKATTCIVGVFPASYNGYHSRVFIRYSDFPVTPALSKDKSTHFPKKL